MPPVQLLSASRHRHKPLQMLLPHPHRHRDKQGREARGGNFSWKVPSWPPSTFEKPWEIKWDWFWKPENFDWGFEAKYRNCGKLAQKGGGSGPGQGIGREIYDKSVLRKTEILDWKAIHGPLKRHWVAFSKWPWYEVRAEQVCMKRRLRAGHLVD